LNVQQTGRFCVFRGGGQSGGLAAEIETNFQAERRPRNPQVNPLRMRKIPVAAFFSFFRLRYVFPGRTSKS
jgi:hypothetical protein